MSDKLRIESTGLAALSALKDLVELLVVKGAITKEEGVHVFTKSAEDHEKVAQQTTTNANADAAKLLRSLAEEVSLMPEV